MIYILILLAFIIIVCLIIKLFDLLKKLYRKQRQKRFREDAKIIDVKTKIAGLKGSRYYSTCVKFDDGYVFVSNDTERTNYITTYKISITQGMIIQIIEEALKAHAKAVGKPFRTTDYMCNNCSLRMPHTCVCPVCKNNITEKDYHPLNT